MSQRYNTIKHGLLARETVLPTEDLRLFKKLERDLKKTFSPAPGLESILVDSLAANLWRLRRSLSIETGVINDLMMEVGESSFSKVFAADTDLFGHLTRYKTAIERSVHKDIKALKDLAS